MDKWSFSYNLVFGLL